MFARINYAVGKNKVEFNILVSLSFYTVQMKFLCMHSDLFELAIGEGGNGLLEGNLFIKIMC